MLQRLWQKWRRADSVHAYLRCLVRLPDFCEAPAAAGVIADLEYSNSADILCLWPWTIVFV